MTNKEISEGFDENFERHRGFEFKWNASPGFSAYLLKKDPKNSYVKGKIISETKAYKKLVKSKHKQYLDQMFTHLDSIQHSDPHGYMQLVKSLRQGSFGKTVPADSDHVPPEDWYKHFQSLLD